MQTQSVQSVDQSAYKTFTDSTGSYSFQYPSNLSTIETNGAVIIALNPKDSTQPHVLITPGAYVKSLSVERTMTTIKISSATFGNNHAYVSSTGYKETTKEKWNQISKYVIPLDNDTDPSQFIEVINYGNSSSIPSANQVESIIASLKINDKAKLLQTTTKIRTFLISQNAAGRVQTDLDLISTLVSEYFDTNKTYVGICGSSADNNDVQRVTKTRNDMASYVGTNNVTCFESASGYAVSVRQPDATIACMDKKGYRSYPPVMATGPSCGASSLQSPNQSTKNNSSDATISQYMNLARNNAENYYLVNSNSYTGFCSVDQEFQSVKSLLTNSSITCKDSATSYAFSASLSSGGYLCRDYYGYNGIITAPNTQTYCVPPSVPASAANNTTNNATSAVAPVSASSVTVTYPTGGSVLHMGQTYNITWTNPKSSTTNYSVYLDNNADIGVSSVYLGSVNANQQTFALKVPSNVSPGNQFQVHLLFASNGNVVASSALFSIAP